MQKNLLTLYTWISSNNCNNCLVLAFRIIGLSNNPFYRATFGFYRATF